MRPFQDLYTKGQGAIARHELTKLENIETKDSTARLFAPDVSALDVCAIEYQLSIRQLVSHPTDERCKNTKKWKVRSVVDWRGVGLDLTYGSKLRTTSNHLYWQRTHVSPANGSKKHSTTNHQPSVMKHTLAAPVVL